MVFNKFPGATYRNRQTGGSIQIPFENTAKLTTLKDDKAAKLETSTLYSMPCDLNARRGKKNNDYTFLSFSIMATKRRPIHTGSKLNFRPGTSSESSTCDPKGKKPLPEPTTVRKVLLMMILHVCRKTLFFDTNLKVGIYGASLFLISLVTDVLPVPKTYFARSDNIFNQYFVKMGWGWTLLMTFPFVVLTSYTYCCGKKDKVVMHVSRLGIATFMWFFWTKLFQYIESNYGRCILKPHLSTKAACIGKGFMWNGFDISGHAFILIYSSLVLIEEARAINGWERMSDLIRNEGYIRDTADGSLNVNPLRSLTEREFSDLKAFYEQFTPYIHSLFIGMTCLCILWDVMLVSTMLYYHIMIEKFVSGAIAILMWFVTYRYWYTLPKVFPNLPGDGLFKYTKRQQTRDAPTKKKTSTPNVAKGQLPKFMGMPLYGLRNQEVKDEKEELFTDEASPASSSKVSVT